MPTPKKKPLEEGYMEVSVRYGNTCAAIRDCFASSTRAYLELCEVKDPSVKKEGSVVLSLSLYTGPSKDSRGRAQKRHRLVIGGVGSIPGAVLGGLFLVFVPNFAEEISKGLAGAVYGAILILVIYAMPSGAAGLIRMLMAKLAGRSR